jgi:hypothetical protein
MPARRLRPRYRYIFTLLAVLFVAPASVAAQGSVTLAGRVSETVTLSVAPSFNQAHVDVLSSNTVRLTLPGDDVVIRVPLLVRSNTSFKISAVFESTTAKLAQLSVTDVHPTGALVSRQAVNSFHDRKDVSRPSLEITGPRVSLGGTLQSPNNALEITVLIRLSPQTPPGSQAYLTFVGSPLQ